MGQVQPIPGTAASFVTSRSMRRLVIAVLLLAVISPVGLALAQDEAQPVIVADIRGPLDQLGIDFLIDAITTPDIQMVVLQLSSPGVASGDLQPLFDAIENAPIPVVAWLGPAGVDVHGGVAVLALISDYVGAAPGAAIGHVDPMVHRGEEPEVPPGTGGLETLSDFAVVIGAEHAPGPVIYLPEDSSSDSVVIDVVTPSIGAFIVGLDGIEIDGTIIETGETVTTDEGLEVVSPSVLVSFLKPTLLDRTLRLAIRPEAAFFFLLIGIAAVAFEFYAAGVGLTAAIAAANLFLAGYGLATLPINWVSLGMVLVGMLLWTAAFQRNRLGVGAAVGTLLVLVGGLRFTDAAPQFGPSVIAVIATVIGIGLFYMFALTTVVRSRFSTQTIGRENLVGRQGVAETDFDPEGVVNIDGARWRARSTRAAALKPGDEVEIYEVKGILLEVGPVE
jgi:membrane-bound serine protease (ClpP class)